MRERLVLEPAAVRGLLVTVAAVFAFFTGKVVSAEWIEQTATVVAFAAPLITGLWIRTKVTSTARLERLGIELPATPRGKHARQELAE